MHPGLADLLDRLAHADRVDARRGRERADRHRDVVAPALGVDDVGEEEGAALVLRDAADELPAHERMQLGVLVDRPVDAHEQALRLEVGEVLLEIEPRPGGLPGAGKFSGFVEHVWQPWWVPLSLNPPYRRGGVRRMG